MKLRSLSGISIKILYLAKHEFMCYFIDALKNFCIFALLRTHLRPLVIIFDIISARGVW